MKEFLNILLEDEEENELENEQVMIKNDDDDDYVFGPLPWIAFSSAYKNFQKRLQPEFRQHEYAIWTE